MTFNKRLIVCCSFVFCLWSANASAQTSQDAGPVQADRDQALRQLLTEVRALRLTLERATLTSTRFQMLIERLRTQQTQVDLLNRQLTSVRSELAKWKTGKTETEAYVKELENKVAQTSGEEHSVLEKRLSAAKRYVESKATEQSQLLQSEADLTTRLQLEESKLTELNSQLDLLLKEIKEP
jgi:cell division protein FtsB